VTLPRQELPTSIVRVVQDVQYWSAGFRNRMCCQDSEICRVFDKANFPGPIAS